MDLSQQEIEILLEVLDHGLEGFLDVDDETTSDTAYSLIEKLRDQRDNLEDSETSEKTSKPLYEIISSVPGKSNRAIMARADGPREAVKLLYSILNLPINRIGLVQRDDDLFRVKIHLGWDILVREIKPC